MKRIFPVYGHIDICEAYEDWMGHVITGHDRNVHLVR